MNPKRRYTGNAPQQPAGAPKWDDEDIRRHRPGGYRATKALADAVNVALILGKPLLVTGEPGTGKTELAWSIAWELGLHTPYTFETRSTSEARDLFYRYDAISHFRVAQSQGPLEFITLNALGKAILTSDRRTTDEVLVRLAGKITDNSEREDTQSVVLIDEIDKAPRDFPNDLLNEFAEQYFTIPELGNVRIDANRDKLPLLLLTSNSEKNLPDAFLRRCIYHDIQFPTRDELKNIALNRVGEFAGAGAPLLIEAIDFFLELRNDPDGDRLEKKPATAELIDWLRALGKMGGNWNASLASQRDLHASTIGALVKNSSDEQRVREMIRK